MMAGAAQLARPSRPCLTEKAPMTATTMRRLGALLALLALALTVSALRAQSLQPNVPPGWHAVTSSPSDYRIGSEPARRTGGDGWIAATMEFVGREPSGAALLQQSVRADEYRGHRIRLAGWVRSASESYAQLWMRVDGADRTIASDYMLQRPILGENDWAPHEIVLDVPPNAVGITFGVMLTGTGKLWVDDLSFESVGTSVATTGHAGLEVRRPTAPANAAALAPSWKALVAAYRNAPLRPLNLSFEQTSIVAIR
jgi:hypothetical protein